MSPILTPLTPFKQQMLVISGLTHHQADASNDGANGDHARGTSTWLTGVHPKHTEGADAYNGISADQIAASTLGKDCALPSIEINVDQNYLVGNCGNGYSCVYMNTLAWRTATTPLPTENNPRAVFERLFGDGGTAAQRVLRAKETRSILDSVTAEMARLQGRLGAADRTRVSDYVEAVREIERRIQSVEAHDQVELPALERPTGIPERFDQHVGLMYELQRLAFQADVTRVFTLMLGRELNFRSYPEIGITEGHHGLSHHGDNPEQMAKYAKLNSYQTQLFAAFLENAAGDPGWRRHSARSFVVPLRGGSEQLEPAYALRLAAGRGRRRIQGRSTHRLREGNADDQLAVEHARQGRRAGGGAWRQHRPVAEQSARLRLRPVPNDAAIRSRRHTCPRWSLLMNARWLIQASLVAVAGVATAGAADHAPSLLEAARAADGKAVRALVGQKADVNAAEGDGTTALHLAVHHDDAAMVDLLLQAGARPMAANRYGVTPLSLAATNANAAITERLLEAGGGRERDAARR